jgi:hypothetical protein
MCSTFVRSRVTFPLRMFGTLTGLGTFSLRMCGTLVRSRGTFPLRMFGTFVRGEVTFLQEQAVCLHCSHIAQTANQRHFVSRFSKPVSEQRTSGSSAKNQNSHDAIPLSKRDP